MCNILKDNTVRSYLCLILIYLLVLYIVSVILAHHIFYADFLDFKNCYTSNQCKYYSLTFGEDEQSEKTQFLNYDSGCAPTFTSIDKFE